jgi:hypothetical protein
MPLDIEAMNLDDTPIEGIEQAFENWQEPQEFPPPPPPGKHSAIIKDIRECKEANHVLSVTLDLEVRGGEADARPLNFVRLSGKMFDRGGYRTSQLLDFVKSAGAQQVPHSNKEFAILLKFLQDQGKTVNFQLDWRAYCSSCANSKLMELTATVTDEAAKDALAYLRQTDGKKFNEVRSAVGKVGTKFKNYKAFPLVPNTDQRKDLVDCPTCGAELRAQANITRWLRPSGGDVPF